MRYDIALVLIALCAATSLQGKAERAVSPLRAQPHYRLGKAPKAEFKARGRTYKINPEARSTRLVRALPPEHFDPTTRRQRVEAFYRATVKDRYEEFRRLPADDCGPFRHEFLHWSERWPAAWRARWAWHHRAYFEDVLWNHWMTDPAFATEIGVLQSQKTPVEDGYLPPEYAATSPVFVYNDEYLNAVYNPVPFLAVLTLKSLKPDETTDWIGTAAAESLVTRLSSTPGLFLAERQQVIDALRDQKLPDSGMAEAQPAAQVGKALDVERVVVGSYVVDGADVLFNLRIVDVQTGVVETGVSKTVPREHLLAAMPDLASSLAYSLGYQSEDELPGKQLPSISGLWQEAPGVVVSVKQTGDRWTATCAYMRPKFGEVRWEMTGTVTADGKTRGSLLHSRAPAGWKRSQQREGKLSEDGNVISGTATWDGGGSDFTWTRKRN